MHGVVMGGGAGISVHGRYRLADSSLSFAMPETGIGFVTDVGGTFFLSRLPGESGAYLALTGARIGQGDAIGLGLVTHALDAAAHDDLLARLADGEEAAAAIAKFSLKPGPAPLMAARPRLDTIFSASTVEAILERLDRDGSEFATLTAQTIRARSPSALKITLHALRAAKTLKLRECLKMEYRIGLRLVPAHDFQEGVRALLIDKDGKPAWRPAALAAVGEGDIAATFAPLGARELTFD